jgi:hypothetical protein
MSDDNKTMGARKQVQYEENVFRNAGERNAWVSFVAASIACDGTLSAVDHTIQADALVKAMRTRLTPEAEGDAKPRELKP